MKVGPVPDLQELPFTYPTLSPVTCKPRPAPSGRAAPAGWAAPAKWARGNIFDGGKFYQWTGPNYL